MHIVKSNSPLSTVRALAEANGIIRPRDLIAAGLPHSYVQHLYRRGELVRVGRGMYMLPTAQAPSEISWVEACLRVSSGIICLTSALAYHKIGTQNPREIWLALPHGARTPKTSELPIRAVRFSDNAMTLGVETHSTAFGELRVFTPAKTVVDCFRFRNTVGLDVAIEALRASYSTKLVTIDDLWSFATALRAANVMRPYLESLV